MATPLNKAARLQCKREVCLLEDYGFFYAPSCCVDENGTAEAVCCTFLSNAAKSVIGIIGLISFIALIITFACFLKLIKWPCIEKKHRIRKVSYSKPSLVNYHMKRSAYNELSEPEIPRACSKGMDTPPMSRVSECVEPSSNVIKSTRISKSYENVHDRSPSFSSSFNDNSKLFLELTVDGQTKYPNNVVLRDGRVGVSKRDDAANLCLPKVCRTQSQNVQNDRPPSYCDRTGSSISLPPLEQLVPVHESTQNNCAIRLSSESSQANQASFLATGSLLGNDQRLTPLDTEAMDSHYNSGSRMKTASLENLLIA